MATFICQFLPVTYIIEAEDETQAIEFAKEKLKPGSGNLLLNTYSLDAIRQVAKEKDSKAVRLNIGGEQRIVL